MLDFRIDTFLTVCRLMNFTRAAEELHITQPAVSHQIHYIEEQYQVKLFEYYGKKVSLTEAGKIFLSAAITMKHDELHLKQTMIQEVKGGQRLIFGATMTIGEYLMPEALARLVVAHPDISIKMVVADTRELLEKLDRGEIEFALVEGSFQKKEYDFLVYDTDRFVIVCAPGYEFHKEIVGIEDLMGERLFIRESGSGTRHVFERYLEEKNLVILDFSDLMEISNIGAIKRMVESGLGITFLYEAAVREELQAGKLRIIELENFQLTHDFTFLWRKESIYSEYYKEMFGLLRGNNLKLDLFPCFFRA